MAGTFSSELPSSATIVSEPGYVVNHVVVHTFFHGLQISGTRSTEAQRQRMNYNRYLDLHLCTSSDMAAVKAKGKSRSCFFTSNGTVYFYEFTNDIMKQMRYREGKNEGFTSGDKGNCKILDTVELTRENGSGWLSFTTGAITEELKQLRYISCMVSIENLKDNTKEWPNLAALVHWISDTSTVNKLRINCHGQGTKTGGFNMGTVTLSAAELVDALVRHGLTRPGTDAAPAPGLLQGARWKADSEKAACEKCNKPFSIMRRRHHCRRCGGLFCDACSSKKADLAVALTEESRTGVGQHYATAKNVKKARVCDACYNDVFNRASVIADVIARERGRLAVLADSSLANNGLKTITLALCMGARTEGEFSPERDPTLSVQQEAGVLIRDSLAGRVLEELRRRNLRGIKIAASNQVVRSTEDEGIQNVCGITYPSDPWVDVNDKNKTKNEIKNRLQTGTATFEFPAYIYGSCKALKAEYNAIPRDPSQAAGARTVSAPITVSGNGRGLYFGKCNNNLADRERLGRFFNKWKFSSWQMSVTTYPPAQPGGVSTDRTVLITAPPRVTRIALIQGAAASNTNRISVEGRAEDTFKQYKSYEVS